MGCNKQGAPIVLTPFGPCIEAGEHIHIIQHEAHWHVSLSPLIPSFLVFPGNVFHQTALGDNDNSTEQLHGVMRAPSSAAQGKTI